MSQTSGAPRTRRTLTFRTGLAASVLALTAGLAIVPAAAAPSVDDTKAQAAAAAQQVAEAKARADASAKQVSSASSQVQGSQAKVDQAGATLTASERELSDAQQALFAVQERLQDARDYDAKLADDLKQAQAALAKAKQAVDDGQQRVDAQRALLAASAREAFQQLTPIEGVSVVLGAETTSELSQRLQWNDTVFDTQSSRKAKLDALLIQLQEARDAQAAIEAKVAADKAASAAQVQVVTGLEREAAAQQASVAQLVAANQESLKAAQGDLADDQRALSSAEEALRLSQSEYEQSVAEEARLTAAVKAAVAGEKASSGSSSSAPSGSSSSGFIRPINANPGSPFGMRFHPILHYSRMHNGTDFGASCGTPIYAARSGTVLMAAPNGGFGNYVLIGHGTINGVYVTTGYAHQNGIYVKKGQQVSQGQIIGYVGTTGLSTGCHLHFEIRHDGTPVNPMRYIP